MIEFPVSQPASQVIPLAADWTELNAVKFGESTRTALLSHLRERELIPDSQEELGSYDADLRSDLFAPVDAGERIVDDIWAETRRRKELLRNSYPFIFENSSLRLSKPSWRDALSYAALLVFDIGHYYPAVDTAHRAGHPFYRHLEDISAACLSVIYGGPAFRFGVPVNPEDPSGLEERAQKMANLFGIKLVGGDLLTAPYGDCTLDVLVRHNVGDGLGGALYVLAQCAAGSEWRKKQGEPKDDSWRDVLRFDGPTSRAIVFPRRLDNPQVSYARESWHFNKAAIYDRLRIAVGCDGSNLPPNARANLEAWVETALNTFPVAA